MTARDSFLTAAGDARFCVAGAAFQGLIACGSTHAFLFLIACGGGMWVSLMPGYKKPICLWQYAAATDAFSDAGQFL